MSDELWQLATIVASSNRFDIEICVVTMNHRYQQANDTYKSSSILIVAICKFNY